MSAIFTDFRRKCRRFLPIFGQNVADFYQFSAKMLPIFTNFRPKCCRFLPIFGQNVGDVLKQYCYDGLL
jgi:hypothetical protein